jgi:TonB family protein
MGGGSTFAALRMPPAVCGALAIAYGILTFYFLARFVWQCARLTALARSSKPLGATDDAVLSASRWSRDFGIGPVVVASSSRVFAPVTMSFVQKRVLLPAGMSNRISARDLDSAIGHEFAHIRRNDFFKNLCYQFLSLPISYHPALWLTRQNLAESREMICDQMAVGIAGNHEYAQSLLRLASLLLQGNPIKIPHAIGVFDANTLERRLMKLTQEQTRIGRTRRYASTAACIALGLATATSALALRFIVDSPQAPANQDSKKTTAHSVPPDVMAQHIIKKVNPKYPPAAKKARIQGSVVLEAVIGKTGHVEKLTAISGPNELQASALDAVRQWTYKPVLLNGAPVEVKTTITVVYSLQK